MRLGTKRVVFYAALYAACTSILKGAGFAVFMWLARALPVEEYARFGLLYALQTGIMTFSLAGIVEVVVGELRSHDTPTDRQALFRRASCLFALLSAVAAGVGTLLYCVVNDFTMPDAPATVFVVLVAVLTALMSLRANLTRLREEHLASLSYGFAAPTASLVGSVLAFYWWRSLAAFFCGGVVGGALALVFLRLTAGGRLRLRAECRLETRLLKRIGPFITITLLGWLSGYGNSYIVAAFFRAADIAAFTFALTVSSLLAMLGASLNMVWSPRFYNMAHDHPVEVLERMNRRFFAWEAVALGGAAGIFLALFPSGMRFAGGNLGAYAHLSFEILLLFCAYVVLVPSWHCQNYFLAHAKGTALRDITVITSAIGIAIWVMMMVLLGTIGIYLGFLTQSVVRSAGFWLMARKYWPITVGWEGVGVGLALAIAGYGAASLLL